MRAVLTAKARHGQDLDAELLPFIGKLGGRVVRRSLGPDAHYDLEIPDEQYKRLRNWLQNNKKVVNGRIRSPLEEGTVIMREELSAVDKIGE